MADMKKPVVVTITGAAGNIGYATMFRVASGEMLGKDQPVIINMLEIAPALHAAEGTAMELADCAFPLLAGVNITDDPNVAFEGANYAMLIGAMPRKKGMERVDLLGANGGIFVPQGKAINDHAADDIRVLVVGNPANTNAVILANSAPDVPKSRITAMMRLDHDRALSSLAKKLDVPVSTVTNMTVWGNHSADQYPDLTWAKVDGKPAAEMVDDAWRKEHFIPKVAQRGTEIINARGASSAASAANAAIAHMRSWALGTPEGDWVSAAIWSDGEHYGIPAGLMFGQPCTSDGTSWHLVEGLEISEESQAGIDHSAQAAQGEIEMVKSLGIL